MPVYTAVGNQNNSSTLITTLNITSATTIRPLLFDFLMSAATPTDVQHRILLQRCTTTGTGTSVTPAVTDPAAVAAKVTVKENHTGEPTYTANTVFYDQYLNGRNAMRWVAAPRGELVMPATANNGLGWRIHHASNTDAIKIVAHFEE